MDVRVFIEGAEVTDWLSDTLGVTYGATTSLNTVTLTLQNPEDIWTLTPSNISGSFRRADGLYSEEAKRTIYRTKKRREDAIKASLKALANQKMALTEIGTYNLGPEQTIFHKHDCIRVFWRNPLVSQEAWMPAFTGFVDHHPFEDNYVVGGSPINLTCYDIKGLMKRMRVASNPMPPAGAARKKDRDFQNAPGTNLSDLLRKEALLGPEAGIFEDVLDVSGFNHVLAGRSFEQAIKFLFFGQGAAAVTGGMRTFSVNLFGGNVTKKLSVRDGVTPPQQDQPTPLEQAVFEEFAKINARPLPLRVGGFDPATGEPQNGEKYSAFKALTATAKEKAELRRIETEVDRLVRRREDAERRAKEQRSRQKAANAEREKAAASPLSASRALAFRRGHVGRIQQGQIFHYPDSSLEQWHNLMLLGNKEGNYFSYDEVSKLGRGTVLDPVQGSPYNGRLHMLLPKGGIPASTMAQADLDVKSFPNGLSFQTRYELVDHLAAQLDFAWYVTPIGDVAFEFPMYDFVPKAFGAYKSAFTLDKHSISASMEDEASDVPTAMVVTTEEGNNLAGKAAQAPNQTLDPNRFVVYAPLLAARLGANVEQISAPASVGGGALSGSGIGGGGRKGAEAWALLQMQKRLGQSSTLQMPWPWRPWLLPNRPVYLVDRERIGITASIQHSLSINSTCQTSPICNYVKKLHSDGKYRYLLGGGENLPINYATMFTGSGDVTHSGLIIRRQVKGGTSLTKEDGTGVKRQNIQTKEPKEITEPYRKIDPKLLELRPAMRKIVANIILDLREQGFKPRITSAYRSAAQQLEKYQKGYSKTAKVGAHNWGLAADIIDRRWAWNSPYEQTATFFRALGLLAKQYGLRWGGDWFGRGGTAANPTHKCVWNKYGIGWDPGHIYYRPEPKAWRTDYRREQGKR